MNMQELDKHLSELSVRPNVVVVHPSVWNGYWSIKNYHPFIRNVFRWLGRKSHNKYLYWVGLPMEWNEGLKELME
jgi:hypothetical protein